MGRSKVAILAAILLILALCVWPATIQALPGPSSTTSLDPSHGPVAWGNTVLIKGYFPEIPLVTFGGAQALGHVMTTCPSSSPRLPRLMPPAPSKCK